MKRTGHLYQQIISLENLKCAFAKARKGKTEKADVLAFSGNLEAELLSLHDELKLGTYQPGAYRTFEIREPKQRTISAAPFRDRVVHHAIMILCEPTFDNFSIHDSYACRKGKGSHLAVDRAQLFCREHVYFLKMDIRKYFNSISHVVLKSQLNRKFKESALLSLFDKIIDSYDLGEQRGLPIGNLTSQYFANFYLTHLDLALQHSQKCEAHVRYMDDFIIWSNDKSELQASLAFVREFCSEKLGLDLKAEPQLGKTQQGLSFLGYRIYPNVIKLQRKSAQRFKLKWMKTEAAHLRGELSERELADRVISLSAFTRKASAKALRNTLIKRYGCVS